MCDTGVDNRCGSIGSPRREGVRRRGTTRTLAATALGVTAVFVLAGCTPSASSTASATRDATPLTTSPPTLPPAVVPTPGAALHPVGPESAWLNDGYGRGLGETWNAGGEICTVIADIAVVARPGELLGRRIGTDDVVWTIATQSGCASAATQEGSTPPGRSSRVSPVCRRCAGGACVIRRRARRA